MDVSIDDISVASSNDNERTEFDLQSSLCYVKQELLALGLSSPFVDDSTELSMPKIIGLLQKLLQLHRHDLSVISQLKDNLTRGKSDMLIQRETQARLKEDIKSCEKELALLEDKERQLNQKIKHLTSKLRAEQDEVRRLKVSMQYKETQRNHENKKKEKEFERLKLKLGQLVSDKSHERRLGVSILNALHKTDGKRKTWNKPGSGDEDMYRVIISNYEERQKELMLENASLRESVAGMEKQLINLLNEKQAILIQQQSQARCVVEAETSGSNLLSSGHFQMPYEIVRSDIEQSFQDKCRLVKEHIDELRLRIERLEASPIMADCDLESEIRKLEHTLSDYRSIIGQQEEMLLQKSLCTLEKKDTGIPSDRSLWRDRSSLDTERQLLLEQKTNLDRDKQKYMDAVHRLDRERKIFEEQKAALLQENISEDSLINSTHELDSFFAKLCSTPAQNSGDSLSRNIVQSIDESSSDSCSSKFQDSKERHQNVDLKHDLSMCSDDGTSILNERFDTALELENAD